MGAGSTPNFNDTGTKAQGISVQVSTITPTLVYSGNSNDREILLQNTSASYKVYLATFSAVTATSGPRMLLRASQDVTTDNTSNIYAIAESAAGGNVEVIGWIEYDPKDR